MAVTRSRGFTAARSCWCGGDYRHHRRALGRRATDGRSRVQRCATRASTSPLLLQAARDEADSSGRCSPSGAGCARLTLHAPDRDGKLKIPKDDALLRPQRLPPGVIIESLRIEARKATGRSPRRGVPAERRPARVPHSPGRRRRPLAVWDPRTQHPHGAGS